MQTQANRFVRIENKYLIPKSLSPELLALLGRHLDPCYPTPGTHYNLIESLYFDSERLDIFLEHFLASEKRYKLRIRRYAPNGIFTDEGILLELKAKQNGITEKTRFRIGRKEHALLSESRPIELNESLLSLNPSIDPDTLEYRIGQINDIVRQLGLRPFCNITYKRQAFERDGLRITCDEDVRFSLLRPVSTEALLKIINSPVVELALAMRNHFREESCWVLEVKHDGVVPIWISDFLNRVNRTEVSFSKYCYSITEALWA